MSREEAIKRIRDFGLYHAIEDLPHSTKTVEAFEMAIQALEVPERNRGKWTYHSNPAFGINAEDAYCSCCNYHIDTTMVDFDDYNFCPNCGADMRKETEDDKSRMDK